MLADVNEQALMTDPVQIAAPPAGLLDAGTLDVSVIVPALNEAPNLPILVPRIAEALSGRRFEILIVDDNSKDNTPQVCAKLAEQFPVRLLVRQNPQHGLSGAVLHGIAAARGSTLVVMDADLQHPPEKLPALLAALDSGADFALGSRYIAGGSTDDQWTLFRKINSEVATFLARPFAGNVRDPMSGFFALRRSTVERAQRLTPLGYKIALELMCKCRVTAVREVPIHFGLRTAGTSKLSLKQQFRYLEHLSRLYDFTFPRASPIAKFLIATILGFVVGTATFLCLSTMGRGPIYATLLGYFGFILTTAVFHLRYVRTQREFLVRRRPWLDFTGIAISELAAVAIVAGWLVRHAPGTPALEGFFISFLCGLIVRYVLRKELLQDIRGLRRNLRLDDWRTG